MKQSKIISISTDMIQLDQLLKWMGVISTGGQARFLIGEGKVWVNGNIVIERRKKIYSGDFLKIDDHEYKILQEIE